MSCLGWVHHKTWLFGWFILWNHSAKDFKSPAMIWKKASSNTLAFFLSILPVRWTNNSDSFPWQAEFWVRVIWGHICSQYQAWNHAFLPSTHRPLYTQHGLWELSLWWLRAWFCCTEFSSQSLRQSMDIDLVKNDSSLCAQRTYFTLHNNKTSALEASLFYLGDLGQVNLYVPQFSDL